MYSHWVYRPDARNYCPGGKLLAPPLSPCFSSTYGANATIECFKPMGGVFRPWGDGRSGLQGRLGGFYILIALSRGFNAYLDLLLVWEPPPPPWLLATRVCLEVVLKEEGGDYRAT